MSDTADITAGIHLPQAGPAASGEAMTRAAVLAEDLGYADVWVSDHLVIPTGAEYPPTAWIYEPLVSMTWVAAATTRVRLGTTVLVLPLRHPVAIAKMIASIDRMSGGRVILGVAAGWLEAEFDAVSVPFEDRGALTDEGITMLRRLWTTDHISDEYPVHGARFASMRALPQPEAHVPIWIGGHAEVALRRATHVGDGWHGAFRSPADTAPLVERLRRDRQEDDFAISMRTRWDPLEDDNDLILAEIEHYREVGVTHLVPEPRQRTLDDYLRSIEAMADLFARAGVAMTPG